MNGNLITSIIILGTFYFLTLQAFFIGGGIFAANVKIPEAINTIGGLCFFFWWLPVLVAIIFRKAILRLRFTKLGSISAIVACAFVVAGSLLFFIAVLFLTSGPITPRAQTIGNFCLSIWWIPGSIGVFIGALTVNYGIDDPASDDFE